MNVRMVLFCLSLVLFSCVNGIYNGGKKDHLTKNLIEIDELSDTELASLQFYLSHKIILQRTANVPRRDITPGHSLKIKHGQSIEELIFEKGTPGILFKNYDLERLCIQFEKHPTGILVFEHSKIDGRYFLVGKVNNRLPYQGKNYQIMQPRKLEENKFFRESAKFQNDLMEMFSLKPISTQPTSPDLKFYYSYLLIDIKTDKKVHTNSRKIHGVLHKGGNLATILRSRH